MKKIILSFALILMLLISTVNAAELQAYVDYDNGSINVSYESGVNYGPMVSVLVYEPSVAITKPDDFINLSDPATIYQLTDGVQLKKAEEERASFEGGMEMSVDAKTGFENGYYIVSASQSGSVDAKCSAVIYYETKESAIITVADINSADRTELDTLIKEKPLFFGNVEDFKKYDSSVLDLMLNIKAEDFEGSFENSSEVKKAFLAAVVINEINKTPALAQELIENNATMLGIDITDENYVSDKNSVMTILANAVTEEKIASIKELETVFKGSIGVVLANKSNQAGINNIIKNYGAAIGISYADYTANCNKYSATNIDKIFVKASFKTPALMAKAYADRIKALEEAAEAPSGGGGGGGSLGGGGGSTGGISVSDIPKEDEKPQVTGFSDLPESHWAYASVMKMKSQNVISGYEDNTFRPDKTVTREEFVKMAISALGYYDSSAECGFVDVSTDRWSYKYVASAVKRELVKGISADAFGATMNITREDAAVIIYRIVKDTAVISSPAFEDSAEISSYAKEAVGTLSANGIVKGVDETRFAPKQYLTRAQTAKLIENVLNYLN